MPKHTKDKHHHHKEKAPRISIFIKNEVKQDGQRQEQKQDKKDESQNGCMAWLKNICR